MPLHVREVAEHPHRDLLDGLLRRGPFVPLMKRILTCLAEQYEQPVDIEFAVSLTPGGDSPDLAFHLLQCRPQNQWSAESRELQSMPSDLAAQDRIFLCTRMVPQGHVSQIEYIVCVDSEAYFQLDTLEDHSEVARCIGQLNSSLDGHPFILVGPGRWGSSDSMQGVPVTYADIFNARVLVEVAGNKEGFAAEPSYGTHFFQDLVESQIYPLAVYPDQPGDLLNEEFFNHARNQLALLLPEAADYTDCLKVIHVPDERPGASLEISMDSERAVAYFATSVEGPRRNSASKQEVIVL